MIRETLIEPEFFRQDFSMMYEEIIRFKKQTPSVHKEEIDMELHKALIIDDERPVRIAIQKLGSWSHYNLEKPLECENGAEGLKLMRELHPCLVFVDMQMPVMTGTEFLKKACNEFKDTAYIVVSGYDDFSYAQSALRYGAMDYILKPVVETELNASIESAMKKLFPDEVFGMESEPSLSAEEVVEMIRDTIEKNYSVSIRISDFSDRYYFSREYLSKLFKQKYGLGIYEYLTNVRMERARELLSTSDTRIRDISLRVGFADTNYFSKAFRNYTGKTPSEFRKMNDSD